MPDDVVARAGVVYGAAPGALVLDDAVGRGC